MLKELLGQKDGDDITWKTDKPLSSAKLGVYNCKC